MFVHSISWAQSKNNQYKMTIHALNRTDKTLPLHLTGVWNGNNATTTLMIIDILIGQERYSPKVIDKHSEAEGVLIFRI